MAPNKNRGQRKPSNFPSCSSASSLNEDSFPSSYAEQPSIAFPEGCLLDYAEKNLVPHKIFKPMNTDRPFLEQLAASRPNQPAPFNWPVLPEGCLRAFDGWYRLPALNLTKAADVIDSIIASVQATRGKIAPLASYRMATAIAAQTYPHLNDGVSEFGNVSTTCDD